MANHAHSTRTPLLPQAGAPSALLGRGAGRQPGPVTLALRAMQQGIPEIERERVRTLRRAIADLIDADIALLDMLSGDADLEDGDDSEVVNEDGGDINDEPHDPEEDMGSEEEGDYPRLVQFDGYNYHSLRAR